MKISQLQLSSVRPEKVEVEFFPEGDVNADLDVSSKIELGQHSDNPKMWRVCLSIHFGGKPDAPVPYKGFCRYAGFFNFNGESEDNGKRFVAVAGSTILYGAIREMVSLLTSRGPTPGVSLPVVTFGDLPFETEEAVEKPEKSTVKKRRVKSAPV